MPILSLFALLLFAGQAVSAETLMLSTHPRGALFELRGPITIRGQSPLPLLPGQQGDYKVRVDLPGHETAYGSLVLRARQNELRLEEARGLGRERVFRSLAFPGAGQIGEGRALEGIVWGTSALGAGITSLALETRYRKAHDEYEASRSALSGYWSLIEEGDTSPDTDAYLALLHETFRLEARSTRRLRDRDYALGALGVVWGLNLIDAALFHSPFSVKKGSDGVLQVELRQKIRTRRVVRSLLYPGFGQSYAGQKARGGFYALAATAAAVSAVIYHLDHEGEMDRVETLDREIAALTPGGPAEAAFSKTVVAEREQAFRRGEEELERRDIAIGVTAVVYVASLIDALVAGPSAVVETEGTRIGFVTPVSSDRLGFGVRVGF
ncbi:MAG: DUF5683 domain-containing protein [Candidatus Eisenbacteria bacterium]